MSSAPDSTVLVTGGSGFIASHCILQLLNAGYRVHTTVRDLAREPHVRALLKQGGVDAGDRLRFFAANLESDAGWAPAVAGCDYVLHVASPLPVSVPKHENELIIPAREGTLRVLRASREAGVKRVVQTSSFAAIGYGHAPQSAPFDETTWTNENDPHLAPYTKSKTLAERAAWDFMAREGGALELSVVNPVAVFGPALGPDLSGSVFLVKRLLEGVPAVPRIYFGIVDVRDVADLQLRAMIHPAAKGERFLAVSGDFMSMQEICRALKVHAGALAGKVSTRQLPDWLVRLIAPASARLRQSLPELGKVKNATSDKARRVLGWSPRSREEAIQASAESLARLGLLRK